MDTDAETVAEAVADTTASVVEGVIDNANERREEAEATAQAIAEGALEGERGRRIEALEGEVRECRTLLAAQAESLASLSSLREQVAEINGAVSALVMATPIQSSSTPTVEAVVEPPTEEVPAVGDPVDAPLEAPVVEEVIPKRKKARWI